MAWRRWMLGMSAKPPHVDGSPKQVTSKPQKSTEPTPRRQQSPFSSDLSGLEQRIKHHLSDCLALSDPDFNLLTFVAKVGHKHTLPTVAYFCLSKLPNGPLQNLRIDRSKLVQFLYAVSSEYE